LGKRPYGYISFRYELTPFLKFGQKNVIAVRVDNSQQPNSRWYSGSGIYRNVWLTITEPVHVDLWGTYVTTPEITENNATINIQTSVRNESAENREVKVLQILLDQEGHRVANNETSLKINPDTVSSISQSLSVKNPILWEIDRPYLYKMMTQLSVDGKLTDQYETPIGLRSFRFDVEKGFFLNGKHLKINGVCNHHDLGALGTSVNKRALERQLQILKDMGCNAIRTSHNPPAPELLQLTRHMEFIVNDGRNF
jgi:beta-galactosidase